MLCQFNHRRNGAARVLDIKTLSLPQVPFSTLLRNVRTCKVDKDYRTYERTIDDMKARESEMAATFVQKVSNKKTATRGGGGGRRKGRVRSQLCLISTTVSIPLYYASLLRAGRRDTHFLHCHRTDFIGLKKYADILANCKLHGPSMLPPVYND